MVTGSPTWAVKFGMSTDVTPFPFGQPFKIVALNVVRNAGAVEYDTRSIFKVKVYSPWSAFNRGAS